MGSITRLRLNLLTWYHQNKRDLPWRHTRDPWAIWVSEIMLQQTRVDSVIDYYHRFLERFPTPTSLACASWDDLAPIWAGLGYYSRAKNLHKAAQKVVKDHAGQVPNQPQDFIQLPGVGPYTCGAVQSIAFGHCSPIVDGNVIRVFSRLYALDQDVQTKSAQNQLWDWARQWAEGPEPGNLNQAIMELGATVCTPKNPQCSSCPLKADCQAYQTDQVVRYPIKIKKKKVLPIHHKVALITYGSEETERVWVAQRKDQGVLGGLWSLPLIDLSSIELQNWHSLLSSPSVLPSLPLFENVDEKNEESQLESQTLFLDLSQWIKDQSGWTLQSKCLGEIEHRFSHQIWKLYIFKCIPCSQAPSLNNTFEQFQSVSLLELKEIAFGGPSLKVLKKQQFPIRLRRGSGKKA